MPLNFTDNPTPVIEDAFTRISNDQMKDLPFINDKLAVKAVGFALHEGDWLGILLTPWTLSIVLIAGPGREWQTRDIGDKIGLRLPSGDYTFIYGEHELLGNYLASSIMSPVKEIANQEAGLQLAQDIRRLITAIPTEEMGVRDSSRRALFGLKSKQPA